MLWASATRTSPVRNVKVRWAGSAIGLGVGMLEQLPEKPPDSLVVERETPSGRILAWNLPVPGWLRVLRLWYVVFAVSWLCCWPFGLLLMSAGLFIGSIPAPVWLLGMALWIPLGCFMAKALWVLIHPIRPESVTLESNVFRYDPGSLPALLFWFRWGRLFYCHPYPDPYEILDKWYRTAHATPRTELLVLNPGQWENPRRLAFHQDGRQVEIGRGLPEADREWLRSVIEAWQRGSADSSTTIT